MAEFQWWLLILGLVAGGGLVAVVSMDGRRREEDLRELERQAEATWIADQLSGWEQDLDARTVERVLRAHREYLALPPPDRLIVEGADDAVALDREPDLDLDPDLDRALDSDLDRDPDREPDDVRDNGRRGPDEDLATTTEQQAAPRQQAHAGADREQRTD